MSRIKHSLTTLLASDHNLQLLVVTIAFAVGAVVNVSYFLL